MSNNEWNPPAPDMNSEFSKSNQSHSESQSTTEESQREIVTAAERDYHQDKLAKLQTERHYTIEGTTEEVVNTAVQEQTQAKVQKMNERLSLAQQRFRKNARSR